MDGLESARKQIDEIDREIARLFERRMKAAAEVAAYKMDHGLPIYNSAREKEVIEKNREYVEDIGIKAHYADFQQHIMDISKRYQEEIFNKDRSAASYIEAAEAEASKTVIRMELGSNSYDIIIKKGALQAAEKLLNLGRKVLIVTDSGVPKEYAEEVRGKCKEGLIYTVDEGEDSKSTAVWEILLKTMLDSGFKRTDAVIAVGGGVCGDLAGFAAASYMRGIDFYNIPTTVLSEVDSSIGGKTAVNCAGIKNVIGAFYQPKRVLIDTELLKTLPKRQLANGLAEALKMALCFDEELFRLFEKEDPFTNLDFIIERSLRIKKKVVEEDEKENGLRKVLNFGHTIGHGIESFEHLSGLYHGECVALGMIPMCDKAVRERMLPVLQKLGLPTALSFDRDKVLKAMLHDKKAVDSGINCVYVPKVGSFVFEKLGNSELEDRIKLIPNIKD